MNIDTVILMKMFSYIGLLVAVTNIITEVLKKITCNIIPTQFIVLIISITLTLLSCLYYCQINNIVILWYHITGSIVLAFMVCYAAIFGFDKLKEALNAGKQEEVIEDGKNNSN